MEDDFLQVSKIFLIFSILDIGECLHNIPNLIIFVICFKINKIDS